MKYDGIMFGNGLTLNLIQQLRMFVPSEKQYLLNVDDFIKCWIQGRLSKREERIIYSSIYGNTSDKWKYLEVMRSGFEKYYEEYDANIEYTIGFLLFKEYNHKDILQAFPAIYNIWYIVLRDYLDYLKLNKYIEQFYQSVKTETGNPQYIWTTNFDLFGESIMPEHVHGRFLSGMKRYVDVVYKYINNGESYYYKYIWGHNGIGKLSNINELKKYADCNSYFDFDFFFSNNIKMDRMLIYGMGFREAGYITDLKKVFSKYEKATIGGIVDEHILIRVRDMQTRGLLKEVEFTYFSETEKTHFEDVVREAGIENYNLIRCKEFNFNIE